MMNDKEKPPVFIIHHSSFLWVKSFTIDNFDLYSAHLKRLGSILSRSFELSLETRKRYHQHSNMKEEFFNKAMRRLTIIFLALASALAVVSVAALAQQSYTNNSVEYTLELPSEKWRVMQEPDSFHEHAECIYGDRNDGYLRIIK